MSFIIIIFTILPFEQASAKLRVVNNGCDVLFNYLLKTKIIEIKNLDDRNDEFKENDLKIEVLNAEYEDQNFHQLSDWKKNFLSKMQFRGLIFIDYIKKQMNIMKCYLPKSDGFNAIFEEIPVWTGDKEYKKVITIKPVTSGTKSGDE